MSLLGPGSWLKSPPAREIIKRWTVRAGAHPGHELAIPQPVDPARFEFLALGDTGDSDFWSGQRTPQDAVAEQLIGDAALPGTQGRGQAVLHLGDVVYMTGERKLYDRNFRRPYAALLCPESTVDDLHFRLPFLPIPGNHDYYDLGGWIAWLSQAPLLGPAIRLLARDVFAFAFPDGGSHQGQAFMEAFVDREADTTAQPLPYLPGNRTRLPNRYYRFSLGSVDFFMLDSNTLIAPPPSAVQEKAVAAAARLRIEALEERAREIEKSLVELRQLCETRRDAHHADWATQAGARVGVADLVREVAAAIASMRQTLEEQSLAPAPAGALLQRLREVEGAWTDSWRSLEAGEELQPVIDRCSDASDSACALLDELESCLTSMPEGSSRTQVLGARQRLAGALERWSDEADPLDEAVCADLRRLSEQAVDVQRELALERQQAQYAPEDYDADQIEWLRSGLEESLRERPDSWRVVCLHHPLYSTIGNHCEGKDVQAVRANLLDILRDAAHLVLAGHSHAFEWLHSKELPHTGLIVSGGGGQVSLRRSILDPAKLPQNRARYAALRRSGVSECAIAGRGPAAPDGERGNVYHYLKVDVTPERLLVTPVGVRRLADGYRREEPMPVFHVPALSPGRPRWQSRRLARIAIRRGAPPEAILE